MVKAKMHKETCCFNASPRWNIVLQIYMKDIQVLSDPFYITQSTQILLNLKIFIPMNCCERKLTDYGQI